MAGAGWATCLARFWMLGVAVVAILMKEKKQSTGLWSTPPALETARLSRLTQQAPSVILGPDLIVSTMVELIGIPALIIWLSALTRTRTAITALQPA